MRENKIEKALRDKVKSQGGKCWKFVSPGTDGVPDRLVLLYKGKIGFVEVKAPGEELSMRHLVLRIEQYGSFLYF